MANDLARRMVFDWLMSPCFEPSALGATGGGITLTAVEDGVKTILRSFPIGKIEADQASAVASLIGDSIVNEAEAFCEGRGGGKKTFTLKAEKDGVRAPIAVRPFAVETERNGDVEADSAANDMNTLMNSTMRLISEMRQERADLHRVIVDLTKGVSQTLPKIMESQAAMISIHQAMQKDNLLMLKANIENQVGREAEAYAQIQKAKDWTELKNLLLSAGTPVFMQFLAKQLGPGDGSDGNTNGQ